MGIYKTEVPEVFCKQDRKDFSSLRFFYCAIPSLQYHKKEVAHHE